MCSEVSERGAVHAELSCLEVPLSPSLEVSEVLLEVSEVSCFPHLEVSGRCAVRGV